MDGEKGMKPDVVHKKWIDRLFIQIETFAYFHSWLVVFSSIFLAFVSIWITTHFLKFNTSRNDLVAQELEYNKLYHAYRNEFDDFDGMIVVMESKKPESLIGFTENLVSRLKQNSELFSKVFYKVDTSFFKKKALLYLELPELKSLAEKIMSHKDFLEEINLSPGLNHLFSGINRKISSEMVDSLLIDLIGNNEKAEEPSESKPAKDNSEDLSLLTSILDQMTQHLGDSPIYSSPWQTYFAQSEESLRNQGYMVSDDGNTLFILLNPKEASGDFKGSKNSIDTIRKLIAETNQNFPDVKVGLTGGEVIASDEMAITLSDVSKASKIALVGITLLFIAVFRNIAKPLMAVFSLLLALSWAMGFTTLTIGHLNILSVVFTTILIGLGIDFGIHIIERYHEERMNGSNVKEALGATIHGTGRGNFSGAITTAIAFGAMTLTDFRGIAELGWIAGFGIIFCLGAMIILLPALIAIEEQWRKKDFQTKENLENKSDKLNGFFRYYRWIIFSCGILTLVASLAFLNLKFDYNILNLQAKGTEAVRYELKIIKQDGRASWYAAMVTNSIEETRRYHKLAQSIPGVGKVESIVSILPTQQDKKQKIIFELTPLIQGWEVEPKDSRLSLNNLVKTLRQIIFKLRGKDLEENQIELARRSAKKFLRKIKELDPAQTEQKLEAYSRNLFQDYRAKIDFLKSATKTGPVTLKDISDRIKKRFVGKSGKYLVTIYPKVNIWDQEAMRNFLKELRKINVKVTGNAVHTYESSRMMKEGYIKGGLYALIAIVFYIATTLRSFLGTILSLLPVFVGGIWTVGIMEILGARFNLANLVILPLILGIGVVNGIHITHRYREEKNKNICVLSKSTGQAIILSSLTTMIGFGSLMIANHQGVFSLGLVLTIGVGACLLVSITLLPALFHLCSIRGWHV